jgi:hypothetical protein
MKLGVVLVVILFHQILKKKIFKINFFNIFESFGYVNVKNNFKKIKNILF